MPLLGAGYISSLLWVKPSWSQQFACGKYSFNIVTIPSIAEASSKPLNNSKCEDNVARMTTSTTLQHSYYFDDSKVVDESVLLAATIDNIAHVSFCVSESSEGIHNFFTEGLPTLQLGKEANQIDKSRQVMPPWILDICLDYFTTVNPYLVELKRMLSHDIRNLTQDFNVDSNFSTYSLEKWTQSIISLYRELSCRSNYCNQTDHIKCNKPMPSCAVVRENYRRSLLIISQLILAPKNSSFSDNEDTSSESNKRIRPSHDHRPTFTCPHAVHQKTRNCNYIDHPGISDVKALYSSSSHSSVDFFISTVLPHLADCTKR